MPNHFHLVVRVADHDAISAYMHWVQRMHACDLRYLEKTKGHGHIFQRRYWSQVIEGDGHLLNVIRYVEANPLRAGLVDRAERWEWGSLWDRLSDERDLLHALPHYLPDGWVDIVNTPQERIDIDAIQDPQRPGRRPRNSAFTKTVKM